MILHPTPLGALLSMERMAKSQPVGILGIYEIIRADM